MTDNNMSELKRRLIMSVALPIFFQAMPAVAESNVIGQDNAIQTHDNTAQINSAGTLATNIQKNTPEEVIVTARRRAESLFKVPGAISAFSEQQVRDLQATDMRGIQYSVPNFYFERSDSSNASVYLRGIGQNDSLPFVEPGVGIYIDDVYVARSQAAFIELFDVERVEVLRGPQGTLYGRNSTGGAVKLVTKQPSDTPEAYLELGAGKFALGTVNARVSGPLTDDGTLKGKVAVTATRRNGFSRNVTEGGRDGDEKLFAWRSLLVFEPNSNMKFDFSFDGKLERPNRSLTPIRKTSLVAFPDPVGDPSNITVFQPTQTTFNSSYVVEGTANDFADLTTYSASVKGEWKFAENWLIESITSFRKMSWDFVLDADNTPLSVLDIPVFEDDDQVSSELRIAFENEAGFAFTGGVFYFHDYDSVLAGFDDAAAPLDLGFAVIPIISVGVPTSGFGQSKQRTNSIAVFVDASVPLGSATSLEMGLRYTRDKKKVRRLNEFFFDPTLTLSRDRPPFLAGIGFPGEVLDGEKSWDKLTPRVVLSHQFDEQTMVYVSASRGFKSGGFPGRAAAATAFVAFNPETVWTYEGGIKAQRFEDRLSISFTYFYNQYKDIQLNGFGQDPVTGQFVSLFTNAARAVTQGAEVSVSVKPLDGLTLDGSAGYLDADYKDFNTLVNGVMTDVSSRRLVNAPKWTGFLGATLVEPIRSVLTATLHMDAAYRGAHANESSDSPNLAVSKVILLNAFASISTPSNRWEVRAGGTNLTNKARAAQSFNTAEFSGVETAFISPPRLYDVRFIFRY